jgi:ABC-2 type transport system ATP-binding protein
MSDSVIEVSGLKFSYGKGDVLCGVDFEVPKGSIFGFLGRNGAGKTTTIKALLGLIKPHAGSCRIASIDSHHDSIAVRRIVGYMAEDQRMYDWMRVEQIVDWVAGFYPSWDKQFTDKLLDIFRLPRKAKVKTLSKGQNSSLALLLALGHHPQVVILDDPTLGLDPIARKEFLRRIVDLLQTNGVTVFFSSHLLYEIEPVADHVAILDKGMVIKAARTDQLRESVKRFIFRPAAGASPKNIPGLLDFSHAPDSATIVVENCTDATRAAVHSLAADNVQEMGLNLDEIFEAYVVGNRGEGLRV